MSSRAILHEIRGDDIHHDPWGTAMAWHFAIADCLGHGWGPPYPPADWGYSSPMGPDENDPRFRALEEMLHAGTVSSEDLLRVGNILHRYERVLERAGRDY